MPLLTRPEQNIADLNKRLTIEAPSRVADGMGGFTVVWTTVASAVPAAIWPASANEAMRAGQVSQEITHRVRIRYRPVIKAGWRLSWGGRYFNVAGVVDPNMAHRWLDLLCKEAAG